MGYEIQPLSQAVVGMDGSLRAEGFQAATEADQAEGIVLDDIGLRGLQKTELSELCA